MATGSRVIANLHYIANGTAARVGPAHGGGARRHVRADLVSLPPRGPAVSGARHDAGRGDRPARSATTSAGTSCATRSMRCCGCTGVDILLTHEAPRPFYVEAEDYDGGGRRRDAGRPRSTRCIAALRPRLHLCGHHHRYAENLYGGVPSVCVDRISRSYLIVDADTFRWRKIDLPQAA